MVDLELRYFDDALNSTLQGATIAHIAATDIAWPDKQFVPIKGRPYLLPEMAGRHRRPMGVGADSVQEWTGIYQVRVIVPRDQGTRLQNEIASDVLKAYRRGLTVQTPQGIFVIVTASSAPPSVPFGDWVQLPVQINWFAHEPP